MRIAELNKFTLQNNCVRSMLEKLLTLFVSFNDILKEWRIVLIKKLLFFTGSVFLTNLSFAELDKQKATEQMQKTFLVSWWFCAGNLPNFN